MTSTPKDRQRRHVAGIVLALTGALLMTGCTPAPTGDALYADAEQTYFSYREVVNELQLEYHDGPWEIGSLGSYGMQPNQCDNDAGYNFTLHRSIRLDASQREEYADIAERFLKDEGLSPSRQVIGADDNDGQVLQVIVRDQGDYELFLVRFLKNGSVGISVDTACRPGDAFELGDQLFGDTNLGLGYLPIDVEAPTDPLFFGITPGDPQFVRDDPTPTPTPTP
ncbi:hypothetical protein [Microbacterium sp. NPDC087665]|uniref:hypothetical protein n=1 Tax=Microbacterium sp. NPDC087665 TaxID=3364194 RepID=UPI003805EFDC